MQILFYSSFLATVALFLFNIAGHRLGALRQYRGRDFARLIPLGLLGLFVYNLLLYTGIDQMLAQDAFILNYLWPIMTVVFSCIVLKEKMRGRTVIALIISFVGVAVVPVSYTHLCQFSRRYPRRSSESPCRRSRSLHGSCRD